MDEKEYSLLSESRLINIGESVIFPLIKKMQDSVLDQIYGNYKSGSTEFLNEVSRLCALKDLEQELKAKQRKGQKIAEKLNNKE